MSFTEKTHLKDELRPLLRDPAQNLSQKYGRGVNYDVEDMDQLLGIGGKRNQRAQWMLFFGVTILSVLILLATLGVLLQISQTRPYIVVPSEQATPSDPILNPQGPSSVLEAKAVVPEDTSNVSLVPTNSSTIIA